MGVGRREFIKLMGLALAGMAAPSLQAALTNDRAYVNKKLGILFERPENWEFIHIKDFGSLRAQQNLEEVWFATQEEMWEDLGDPICMATKYAQDDPTFKGVFSPTISVYITPETEVKDDQIQTLEDVIHASEYGTALMLKDFKVIRRDQPYTRMGLTFYERFATYLFDHEELNQPLPVELLVLSTEHNGLIYDFNMHQCRTQGERAEREFEEFVRSIKFV